MQTNVGFYSNLSAAAFWTINLSKSRTLNLLINKEKRKTMDSTQLFLALKNAGVKADADGPLWWPNAGTFEVVVGAVLIQNTNWKNADKALNNLKTQI